MFSKNGSVDHTMRVMFEPSEAEMRKFKQFPRANLTFSHQDDSNGKNF